LVFSLFPDDNPQLSVRLKRQLMAVYSYCIIAVGIYLAIRFDVMDKNMPTGTIFGGIFLFNAIVFVIIRKGWSNIFQDPSLTFFQVFAGVVINTILLHYGQEVRGVLISIYFMVMTFGIFALKRKEMMVLALATVVSYATLIYVETLMGFPRSLSLSLSELGVLGFGLTWFVYVGGYIHNLQVRIREQRGVLESAQNKLEISNSRLQDALKKLERIVIHDELTGIYNRRHLMERLEEQIALSHRKNLPLFLAMIDLDHFKKINDEYGHIAGDEVLVTFAQMARQHVRRSDLVARYGGEEFIIAFCNGSEDNIYTIINRLRESFFEHRPEFLRHDANISFSAGVSALRPGDTPIELISRADEALYRAKALGRNRIEMAP